MMAQVESFPHDAAAVDGDTPATGAWNLGDQTVRETGDDLAFEWRSPKVLHHRAGWWSSKPLAWVSRRPQRKPVSTKQSAGLFEVSVGCRQKSRHVRKRRNRLYRVTRRWLVEVKHDRE
jgi:hypothetical protein